MGGKTSQQSLCVSLLLSLSLFLSLSFSLSLFLSHSLTQVVSTVGTWFLVPSLCCYMALGVNSSDKRPQNVVESQFVCLLCVFNTTLPLCLVGCGYCRVFEGTGYIYIEGI